MSRKGENEVVGVTSNSLLSLIFLVFLVMKLTEKCTFWGDAFPSFLKSTEAWWDGWFMVFLPLWGGIPIALIICFIIFIVEIVKR